MNWRGRNNARILRVLMAFPDTSMTKEWRTVMPRMTTAVFAVIFRI
jgi:hypothetical protein